MNNHTIYIDTHRILVNSTVLQEYLKVNKSTVSGWKKKDRFPDAVEVVGEKALYYDFVEVLEWKKRTIKDKFNPKGRQIDIPPSSDNLPDEDTKIGGLEIEKINLKDRVHLNIIAKTQGGADFLDALKMAEEIISKSHKQQVEEKKYIVVSELDTLMSEFMAIIHNNITAMRDQLPLSQMESLIEKGIVDPKDKEKGITALKEIADSYFDTMYKHSTRTLFDEVDTDTMIEYFEMMKQNYIEESEDEK